MLYLWLPVAAYAALIFSLSSIPDARPPLEVDHIDKVAHVLEYGGFGALLFRAFQARWHPSGQPLVAGATVLTGAVVAALDELYQGTTGREKSLTDWGADTAGLILAALGALYLVTRRTSRPLRRRSR